ncbi:hypothetical protein C8F01DRAFT_1143104 [Mycena amicta]|nr:hypothetical protein C8F01DRAFT_1143104 [Mycena amicta]
MHPSLLIAEVVDIIFDNLDAKSPESRRALVALVKTCKSFSEPALDALWREQDTLDNVLKCLPKESWRQEQPGYRYRYEPPGIVILRPLQPDDWTMVSKFLPRVKSLTLKKSPNKQRFPTQSALDALLAAFPKPGSIFPNLRKLCWSQSSPYISIFLGPRITELSISGVDAADRDARQLPDLVSLANIVHLDVYVYLGGKDLILALSSQIALHAKCPRTMCLSAIDRTALEHISVFPELRHLKLHRPSLGDCGPSDVPLSSLEAPLFPSLRLLDLGNTTNEFAFEFLRIVGPGVLSLKEFYVTPDVNLCLPASMNQLLEIMVTNLDATALVKLEIGELREDSVMNDPPHGTLELYTMNGADLLLLARFTSLTILTLQSTAGFAIDDEVLWELAPAWPNLTHLRLHTGSCEEAVPTTTLRGLRALAKYCTVLESLRMPVNASKVPSVKAHRPERISSASLTALHVNSSPISSGAVRVAIFLSGIFPSLSSITTLFDPDYEDVMEKIDIVYMKRWQEAEKWLPTFTLMRREEQNYAALESGALEGSSSYDPDAYSSWDESESSNSDSDSDS